MLKRGCLPIHLLGGLIACLAGSVTAMGAAEIEFLSDQTRFPAGASRVIPFRLSEPARESTALPLQVRGHDVIDVLRLPRILAGETVGFLRVRGLRPGAAALRMPGAELSLEVFDSPWSGGMAGGNEFWVSCPPNGAYVWGTFTAGVEVFLDPLDPAPPSQAVRLRLPSGRVLMPRHVSPAEAGPLRQFLFDVPGDALAMGPAELVALVRRPDGQVVESDPVQVVVARGDLILEESECEDLATRDRPAQFEGFQDASPIRHPGASRRAGLGFYANRVAMTFPLTVDKATTVQLMAVARGDAGGGGYPTVGVFLNERAEPLVIARVLGSQWHRMALGTPVMLGAGEHLLTFRLMNELTLEDVADRKLYLDRVEVAEIGGGVPLRSPSGRTVMQPDPGMVIASMTMENGSSGMDPDPNQGRPLRVAYNRNLHGEPVTGRINLRMSCWWDTSRAPSPPLTSLLINGDEVSRQQSSHPDFRVHPSLFRDGANSLQVMCRLPDGEMAYAPAQTIFYDPPAPAESKPIDSWRFDLGYERWSANLDELRTKDSRGIPQDTIRVADEQRIGIVLPEELRGHYALIVDGQARTRDRRPGVEATFRARGRNRVLPDRELGVSRGLHPVGSIRLPGGDQRLMLRVPEVVRDGVASRQGHLELRGIVLEQVTPHEDQTAPRVDVLYPKPGQQVFQGDVIIVRATDDTEVRVVDVRLDGEPTGIRDRPVHGMGLLVLPISLRDVAGGERRIGVGAVDASGNRTDAEDVPVQVAVDTPNHLTRYQRAVRLLNRFAYGPEDRELAAVLLKGEQAWLRDRLGRSYDHPAERNVRNRLEGYYPGLDEVAEIENRALRQLVESPNPVRARFVMWCENHFSTWLRKVGAEPKWLEHQRFSQLGPALFSDLLKASATSPAMLVYLDQDKNITGQINENYAREIMELHTLGVHGGYGQDDVTELATLLTGWTVSEEAHPERMGHRLVKQFRFDPLLNGGDERRVVGMDFPACPPGQRFDRVRVALEALAAHPSTARYISEKLIAHYVAVPAPPAMVEDLIKIFHRTGGDMTEMVVALAAHPAFWEREIPAKLATPLDFGVRLARVSGQVYPETFQRFLRDSGMPMFGRPSPDGYPEEPKAYADTNAFLQRWNFARRIDHQLTAVYPSSILEADMAGPDRWEQLTVDVAALRLTGELLGTRSNVAAMKMIQSSEDAAEDRARMVAGFIGFLPEANLR